MGTTTINATKVAEVGYTLEDGTVARFEVEAGPGCASAGGDEIVGSWRMLAHHWSRARGGCSKCSGSHTPMRHVVTNLAGADVWVAFAQADAPTIERRRVGRHRLRRASCRRRCLRPAPGRTGAGGRGGSVCGPRLLRRCARSGGGRLASPEGTPLGDSADGAIGEGMGWGGSAWTRTAATSSSRVSATGACGARALRGGGRRGRAGQRTRGSPCPHRLAVHPRQPAGRPQPFSMPPPVGLVDNGAGKPSAHETGTGGLREVVPSLANGWPHHRR